MPGGAARPAPPPGESAAVPQVLHRRARHGLRAPARRPPPGRPCTAHPRPACEPGQARARNQQPEPKQRPQPGHSARRAPPARPAHAQGPSGPPAPLATSLRFRSPRRPAHLGSALHSRLSPALQASKRSYFSTDRLCSLRSPGWPRTQAVLPSSLLRGRLRSHARTVMPSSF